MFGPSGTIAEDLLIARSLSLDENGRVVAAIEIRRMPGGVLVGSIPANELALWRPFISADGRYVAFGSGQTGGYAVDVRQALDGASMEDAIVFNPLCNGGVTTFPDVGGGWFVMGQSGGVLRFYDLETSVEEMTLPVDTDRGTLFRITADGRNLYYQGAGGVLRRFPLDDTELVALAEQRVQRDFTEAECERFAIADDCSNYEPAASS